MSLRAFHVLLASVALATTSWCMIEQIQMPLEMQNCYRTFQNFTDITKVVGETISHYCINQYMWTASAGKQRWTGFNVSSEGMDWLNTLMIRHLETRRAKRQADSSRVSIRREYRMLSDRERALYHRAVQMLKADTSVPPNRYDFISAFHQGIVVESAHTGPNFFGWHRIYLVLYELALQQMVPSVTLPYWDSTLDFDMADPTESIIWTPEFLGNGNGFVTNGPFANWQTDSGPLTRNIGSSSRLMSKEVVDDILSRWRMSQISVPTAEPRYNLEFHHGGPHTWVDGQMGSLNTAAQDPVFFMLHAYIDYVWELFRMRQRQRGVDPSSDYPDIFGTPLQAPNRAMDGIARYTNLNGYDDFWTNSVYAYSASPTCSSSNPDCGSQYLWCDVVLTRCVSVGSTFIDRTRGPFRTGGWQNQFSTGSSWSTGQQNQFSVFGNQGNNAFAGGFGGTFELGPRFTAPSSDGRTGLVDPTNINDFLGNLETMVVGTSLPLQRVRRNTHSTTGSRCSAPSVGLPHIRPYQNTYFVNGISDIRKWAYIPVKIVYQRPPTGKYGSYPIRNGVPNRNTDIYNPSNYPDINRFISSGQSPYPSILPKCSASALGAGKVFIQSDGLNYMGKYKDYAVVDQRFPVSSSTAYIAVKSPKTGMTDALLSAYDSCGRVCRPACKVVGSNLYRPCAGAIRVSSNTPYWFGDDYGGAILNEWNFGNADNPYHVEENVFVTFYCDHLGSWPWEQCYSSNVSGSQSSLGNYK